MSENRSPPLTLSLVAMLAAVSMASAFLAVLFASRLSPPPTLAVVQIDRVLAEHVSAVANRDWDEARQQAEVRRFAAALDAALTELSDEGRVVLLSAPAVVRGAPDWTPALQARLQRALDAGAPP